MAVFTNIDNTLKETINVNYRTRETNQKVRFCNEENEYWGTFRGVLSVDGATLGNCRIYDAEIDNAVFSNVRFKDGIDFTTLNETVLALSLSFDELDTTVGELQTEVNRVNSELIKEITVRGYETSYLSGCLDATAQKLDFEVERLDGRITADQEDLQRISADHELRITTNKMGLESGMDRSDRNDAYLSGCVDYLSACSDYLSSCSDYLSACTDHLSGCTDFLSGRLDDEAGIRYDDDSYLSGRIDDHEQRLTTVEKKVKSGVIYKGKLEVDPSCDSFRNLFRNNFPEQESMLFEAGFMYMVDSACVIEGVKLGTNDYIIFNRDTTLARITKDMLDHLDAMDSDVVRQAEFQETKAVVDDTAAKFSDSGLLILTDSETSTVYELAVMNGSLVLKAK